MSGLGRIMAVAAAVAVGMLAINGICLLLSRPLVFSMLGAMTVLLITVLVQMGYEMAQAAHQAERQRQERETARQKDDERERPA